MKITQKQNHLFKNIKINIAFKQRAIGLILFSLSLFLFISCASYKVKDPSFNFATANVTENMMGSTGATIADLLFQFFGLGGFLLGVTLISWSGFFLMGQKVSFFMLRFISLLLSIPLINLVFSPLQNYFYQFNGLGALSILVLEVLPSHSFIKGLLILFLSVLGGTLYIISLGFSLSKNKKFAKSIGKYIHLSYQKFSGIFVRKNMKEVDYNFDDLKESYALKDKEEGKQEIHGFVSGKFFEDSVGEKQTPLTKLRDLKRETENVRTSLNDRISLEAQEDFNFDKAETYPEEKYYYNQKPHPSVDDYTLPSLELLEVPSKAIKPINPEQLEESAHILQSILAEFGVMGDIVQIRPGPVVTLYEFKPAPGIKTSRVISLADDIARSMSALSARIATIPGRNVIGIELPNPQRETVYLRDLLMAEEYQKHSGHLPLVVGKDIGGYPIIVDLSKMPHLLVAGTTGSGKSVSINTMILSLLYRYTYDQCKLIMIDPKMLELSVYDDIPHLLTPVVTNPKKAVVALKWAVREMESRYRLMSKLGVRNIDGYNIRIKQARENGEILQKRIQTGFDPDSGKPVFENQAISLEELPFIVIIVDEMADLMMVAGKEIESAVQRLAQMARAAGIHLIMATQRPSVDVITGTIKANFPTRISFQVTSKIDSRTILGEQGAEQLLGQGDMLYMAGGGRIIRVHGPYVKDREVEKIVEFLRSQGEPQYVDSVTEDLEELSEIKGDGEVGSGDLLYKQAMEIVLKEGKASTSFIQRHLQIGYNRAARIIEQMEKEGVVSPANHVGKREILI